MPSLLSRATGWTCQNLTHLLLPTSSAPNPLQLLFVGGVKGLGMLKTTVSPRRPVNNRTEPMPSLRGTGAREPMEPTLPLLPLPLPLPTMLDDVILLTHPSGQSP